MPNNLSMDNIKAALEDHKKAIEEKVNKAASAEDVEQLRKVSEQLSADIKSITDAIKLAESKKLQGLKTKRRNFL